jgi:hypothetical protein
MATRGCCMRRWQVEVLTQECVTRMAALCPFELEVKIIHCGIFWNMHFKSCQHFHIFGVARVLLVVVLIDSVPFPSCIVCIFLLQCKFLPLVNRSFVYVCLHEIFCGF